MINLKVTVTPESYDLCAEVFDDLIGGIREFPAEAVDIGLAMSMEVMIANFGAEGNPPWAPLRLETRKHRVHYGYGERHPILYRTGSLLAALTREESGRMVMDISQSVGSATGILGTTDPRFEWLQDGIDGVMEARSIWPIGSEEMEFVHELEGVLVGALEVATLG